MYNWIISRVSSDFDMLLEDTDIDTIILGKNSDYSDSVIRLVKQMTKQYVNDFLGALRKRGIDLKSGCIVFIGGGAKLLREYLENTDKIGKCVFVEDICANAKGYEILYQVAEFLNSLEREKAQYIVKRFLHTGHWKRREKYLRQVAQRPMIMKQSKASCYRSCVSRVLVGRYLRCNRNQILYRRKPN